MQEINNFELTGVNNFKHFLLNLPQSTERGLVVFSGVLENKNIYKNAIFTTLKKTENRIVTNLVIDKEVFETTIGKKDELEINPMETLNLISKENFTQWIMDFHLMRQLGYIILILKGI